MSQARDGIRAQISQNPARVTIYRVKMIDNGFGGLMPDPLATPEQAKVTVRIAHEALIQVPKLESSPIGLSTNLGRFILADYKTEIQEGDRLNYIGYGWEIGVVDPLVYGEKIIGYQAPLKMADPFPEPYIEEEDDDEENGEEEKENEVTP